MAGDDVPSTTGQISVKLTDIITKYVDSATSGDFADWIEKLELVAKLQGITDLKTFLPLFLNGAAFAVYKQLPEHETSDYARLKAALLQAFGVNCYAAYEMLQRRVLQEGETVDVYLAEIRKLVTLIGIGNVEPLLKCAFMAGLPSDIAVQLKSVAAVETLGLNELVNRARMILSTRSSDATCAVGYNSSPKPRFGSCFACGNAGHFARDCPQQRGGERGSRPSFNRKRTCFICDEEGHLARFCPKKGDTQKVGNSQGGASAPDASPGHQ